MERVCTRCHAAKPLSGFKFESDRQRYRTVCRLCFNERKRQRYAADEEFRAKAVKRAAQSHQIQKATPEFLEKARVQRRAYKRLGRLCAKPGYEPVKHDGHVNAWKAVRRSSQAKPPRPELHDAHVREARSIARVWWHIRVKHLPRVAAARRERRKVARDGLADSYIVRLLTNSRTSCPVSAGIPMRLIELKRAHLRLVRHLNLEEGDCE